MRLWEGRRTAAPSPSLSKRLRAAAFASAGAAASLVAACEMPEADPAPKRPFPEVTLAGFEEKYLKDRRCETEGQVTNTGPVQLRSASLRINYHLEDEIVVAASISLPDLARDQSTRLRLPYACDDAIGARRLRVYMQDLPIRVVQR